jgi:hypothetical protein
MYVPRYKYEHTGVWQLKYYHYTYQDSVDSILEDEKLKDSGSGVYVCDNEQDLLKFIKLKMYLNRIKKEDIAVIEFETDLEFEEGLDHDPSFLDNASSLVHFGDVPISNVNIYNLIEE